MNACGSGGMAHTSCGPAKKAPVAQLDRAPDYESGGRTFESFRARHLQNCEYWGSHFDQQPSHVLRSPCSARLRAREQVDMGSLHQWPLLFRLLQSRARVTRGRLSSSGESMEMLAELPLRIGLSKEVGPGRQVLDGRFDLTRGDQ